MEENQENVTPNPEPSAEPVVAEAAPASPPLADMAAQLTQGLAKREGRPPRPEQQPQVREPREPRGEGQKREGRGDRGPRPEKGAGGGGGRPGGERGGGDRGPRPGGDRREGGGGRPGGGDRGPRSFEPMMDIDIEKLISDSLYLDNQAHAVVARMRDMDSGTKSQLRRLFNAVRRAVRAPESDKQHQFVMLRARLAYTIARHSLRSLDGLERLLLQVTRKNNAQGYERFKDLFEAIVAYNE
ncbi:MAG: type III-A CRISPR-associated protein Csm2 [Bryobacteraceae bacterium]